MKLFVNYVILTVNNKRYLLLNCKTNYQYTFGLKRFENEASFRKDDINCLMFFISIRSKLKGAEQELN